MSQADKDLLIRKAKNECFSPDGNNVAFRVQTEVMVSLVEREKAVGIPDKLKSKLKATVGSLYDRLMKMNKEELLISAARANSPAAGLLSSFFNSNPSSIIASVSSPLHCPDSNV
jgi:hypothetical protein